MVMYGQLVVETVDRGDGRETLAAVYVGAVVLVCPAAEIVSREYA